MQHSFDIDIACQYGILEAILLNHLWFWIEKNKANNQNYYDGYYWTFNSTRAYNELFPYASQRQIQNALKKLRDDEVIQVGNHNQNTYDRTLWYAFTKKGECIMQKCKMDNADLLNRNGKNVEPIPYINTYINNNTTTIYDFIEENFKRGLTPIEYEEISLWEDNELTRYAIKQSILNNVYSIKYISRILQSYKQKGIESVQQAQKEEERFKNNNNKQQPTFTKKSQISDKKTFDPSIDVEPDIPTEEELKAFEELLKR